MNHFDALIHALETAEKGSPKLDQMIANYVESCLASDAGVLGITPHYPGVAFSVVPRYTRSLDSALTLLPENQPWQLTVNPKGDVLADCYVIPQCVSGSTPPLALCIAALKARAELNRSQ